MTNAKRLWACPQQMNNKSMIFFKSLWLSTQKWTSAKQKSLNFGTVAHSICRSNLSNASAWYSYIGLSCKTNHLYLICFLYICINSSLYLVLS
mmetsp:Transcript_2287/g.3077  ORF Transcript_2287/g.3077 Transcript_2287/m.3077 type:complete len:93 (+) Transcript_2287:1023-1301(+)